MFISSYLINLKKFKLHFKLLTQSQLMLETQFYPCSLSSEIKVVYYFGHSLNQAIIKF